MFSKDKEVSWRSQTLRKVSAIRTNDKEYYSVQKFAHVRISTFPM